MGSILVSFFKFGIFPSPPPPTSCIPSYHWSFGLFFLFFFSYPHETGSLTATSWNPRFVRTVDPPTLLVFLFLCLSKLYVTVDPPLLPFLMFFFSKFYLKTKGGWREVHGAQDAASADGRRVQQNMRRDRNRLPVLVGSLIITSWIVIVGASKAVLGAAPSYIGFWLVHSKKKKKSGAFWFWFWFFFLRILWYDSLAVCLTCWKTTGPNFFFLLFC